MAIPVPEKGVSPDSIAIFFREFYSTGWKSGALR
jgi:hypothetical protein